MVARSRRQGGRRAARLLGREPSQWRYSPRERLFHLAAQQDWERASSARAYTTASLREDGFIHCVTATQHARVANDLYSGRTDLVLLLIDTDRLTSEVRLERADPGAETFPHVYGPVDLDAIFEATPYRPGSDGRFRPYEEASGFAAHGAATLQEVTRWALEVMAGFAGSWWVAGGWALDLFLGHKTRPHADLELSILATDQEALFEHLQGWDLRLAAPRASLPPWDGSWIQPPFHQVWARRGGGCPADPDQFAADPTMLGFLLEQSTGDRWLFRRHPAVTRPLTQVGTITAEGVAVVRPEIALLFKAKGPRFKDRRDFDHVLPYLDGAARAWLGAALEQVHPGHAWGDRL
jgi:uncharacterized protein (DUF952 family)